MNNAGLPGKPSKFSGPPGDDIPEALRDTPDIRRRYRLKPILLISGLVGIGAIALLLGIFVSVPAPQPTVKSSPAATSADSQSEPSPNASEGVDIQGRQHFAYEEAPASELQPITPDGRIQLRTTAAQKFKAMSAAAAREGVILAPISGFRSVSEQQYLFFDIKAQRGQAATKRAEVSAPPGYSEHHTGYAVDIGDGKVPSTNLSPSFENTAAFKWMEQNAASYNFELSFPRDNPQGINYEPWHWRFVGDRDRLETFYKVKNLTRPASTPTTELSPTPSATPATEP
ncbi:MAG: D-alanyl-D-alanine carboxypeptidase family protein [Coleofasciculus sp. S288]|nr:D-alanyl-D-alanine carboxypeptidase family protein [Coleofasciculus sp. S288]